MKRSLVALALVVACAKEVELGPREEFRWTAQAISFQPPPAGWRREGELSGGVRGVSFVREGSVGEAITVGELHAVAERDRSKDIEELVEQTQKGDVRGYLDASRVVRWRTDGPLNDTESDVAARVNESLRAADRAMLDGDPESARRELAAALVAAAQYAVSVDDIVEPLIADRLRRAEPADFAKHTRRELTIAGVPAVSFEWSHERNHRTYLRREAVFAKNNHVYVTRFIGLEESLPLYERLVASIELPE